MGRLHTDQTEGLSPIDAVLLGLIQGPAELLPISSSAHISLVPWLFGLPYSELDPELRKSVEVALHAGAAVALLIGQRRLVAEELRGMDGRRFSVMALSFAPAAFVGMTLERPIEQRLGGPGATALGLILGSMAMVAADHHACRQHRISSSSNPIRAHRRRINRPLGRRGPAAIGRAHREADWRDGLALGLAQAMALAPGVSRNGATLTAARWRGFSREDANLLSRVIALPVIAGASLLKGLRMRSRELDRRERLAMGAGVAASIASTLVSQRLIQLVERDRALWPYAAYRILLATLILARRRGHAAGHILQDS